MVQTVSSGAGSAEASGLCAGSLSDIQDLDPIIASEDKDECRELHHH